MAVACDTIHAYGTNHAVHQRWFIEGGWPLTGEVRVGGAKNSALPILTATLLTDEPVLLADVPSVADVWTICELLRSLGKEVDYVDRHTLRVHARGDLRSSAPYELVKRMRASFWVLGPLLARMGRAEVPLPGGCIIGQRPVDLHLKGLRALGAEVTLREGVVRACADSLSGNEIYLDYPSVGATEQLMMAAALARGRTVIENPAHEPEVLDLQAFLCKMGAKIEREPTRLIIDGGSHLGGAEHVMIPDRINAGTYLLAGAITCGEVLVRCRASHLDPLLSKLGELGVRTAIKHDGNAVLVQSSRRWRGAEVETRPHPGFPTDLQPQMTAFLSLAEGESLVRETVFEGRFAHAAELARLGARVRVAGTTAWISGVPDLQGAVVQATDMRAGAALVLAGLAARGTTTVIDDGHIARGYANLSSTLRRWGARIAVERCARSSIMEGAATA